MLTPFGKALRKLRLERGLLLKDMADRLEVSPSFLSAVESGRKSIPAEMPTRIAEYFKLSTIERDELRRAQTLSAREMTIRFSKGAGAADAEAAALLARTFEDGVSEDFLAGLKSLIERKQK